MDLFTIRSNREGRHTVTLELVDVQADIVVASTTISTLSSDGRYYDAYADLIATAKALDPNTW